MSLPKELLCDIFQYLDVKARLMVVPLLSRDWSNDAGIVLRDTAPFPNLELCFHYGALRPANASTFVRAIERLLFAHVTTVKFEREFETNPAIVQALLEYCPNIDHFEFSRLKDNPFSLLQQWPEPGTGPRLASIKFFRCSRVEPELVEFMTMCLPHLTDVWFYKTSCYWPDIDYLEQYVANIEYDSTGDDWQSDYYKWKREEFYAWNQVPHHAYDDGYRQWQMTTELWQAVRTSSIEHVKEVLQHLRQYNDGTTSGPSTTPRAGSEPFMLNSGDQTPTNSSRSSLPAHSDNTTPIKKSTGLTELSTSVGSNPTSPKTPDSAMSSSRGKLLATNQFWRELLNAVDDQGFSSLTWAVLLKQEEIIILLLENGADPNIADMRGNTPLHWAVDRQDITSLRVLLKYRRPSLVNLNHQDHRGMTAVHRAAACGNLRFVQMLREAGAKLSIQDARGWTALHMAAYYNRPEVIDYAVQQGSHIDEPNRDGWTALHLAALGGHHELVRTLTRQYNANPLARSVWGQTPLHVAVEAEQEDITRILIEEGASPEQRDNFGKLPEDEATQDILFLLKKTTCPLVTTAENCSASGSGLTSPVLNREAKVTIQARDQRGLKRFNGGDPFEASVVQLIDGKGSPLACQLRDNNNGTYTVTYTPKELGPHQITIKLGYITINGSPFTAEVGERRSTKKERSSRHKSEAPSKGNKARAVPAGPETSPGETETPRTAEANLSPALLLRQMPKFGTKATSSSSKRAKHHEGHKSDVPVENGRSKRATINFGEIPPLRDQVPAPFRHSDAAPPVHAVKKEDEASVAREKKVIVLSHGSGPETSPDRIKKSPKATDSPRRPGPDARVTTKSDPPRTVAAVAPSGSQVELSRRVFELQTASQKLQNDLKGEQQQSMQLRLQVQGLERRLQQAEAINACQACATQPRSAVFSPCHHMLHCYHCACKYAACPSCHMRVTHVIEIKRT